MKSTRYVDWDEIGRWVESSTSEPSETEVESLERQIAELVAARKYGKFFRLCLQVLAEAKQREAKWTR